MAKQTVAGAMIIDRIRERIVGSRYLGVCRPGQRLPSIREVAQAEGVNRKTVAAAYLRLQEEGLVDVRARSGIYLAEEARTAVSSPLDRLHRRWLGQTVSGARALGMESSASLRLLAAVATVERTPIPVLECNRIEGAAIAGELSDRLGLHAVPLLLSEFRRSDVGVAPSPVVITTPWHADEVAKLPGVPATIIEVTISDGLAADVLSVAEGSDGLIVTGSDALASKIHRALRGTSDAAARTPVVSMADEIRTHTDAGRRRVLVWPGTPASIQALLPRDIECIRPQELLSAHSIECVQNAILDAALKLSKSSSAVGGSGAGAASMAAAAPAIRVQPPRP